MKGERKKGEGEMRKARRRRAKGEIREDGNRKKRERWRRGDEEE